MNSPYQSLCAKFIIYAIILCGYQMVRKSFFMAPADEYSRGINGRDFGKPNDKRIKGT